MTEDPTTNNTVNATKVQDCIISENKVLQDSEFSNFTSESESHFENENNFKEFSWSKQLQAECG